MFELRVDIVKRRQLEHVPVYVMLVVDPHAADRREGKKSSSVLEGRLQSQWIDEHISIAYPVFIDQLLLEGEDGVPVA